MRKPYAVAYAAALLAFFLPALSFPGVPAGGLGARWVALAALAGLTALAAWGRGVTCPRPLRVTLFAFSIYALATALWSESPALTVSKWLAFVLVAPAFLLGGAMVAGRPGEGNPFAPLAPVFLFAVGSSLLAVARGADLAYSQGLFQGYLGGPNMLGSTLAFSSPWVVEEIRRSRAHPLRRVLWLAAAGAGLWILALTRSRSAMLMVVAVAGCIVLAARPGRRLLVAFVAAGLLLSAGALAPRISGRVFQSYVYKSGPTLLYTRQEPLQVSWQRARAGGATGVGFGVSSGLSSGWSLRTTSHGFGREKASSPLAVAEELGWVGLALYAALLAGTAAAIRRLGRRAGTDAGARFHHLLLWGFFAGALGSSLFEAWFTAPGSPEAVAYWATLGMGMGALGASARATAERARARRGLGRTAPAGSRPARFRGLASTARVSAERAS